MNSGALESLGQSPAAKRLKIPFPVGDLGRADPAGLQLSATAATCLSRPVGDLGSTVRPVHRRQRLREPSNAANGCGSRRIRAEGGGKRCASWTRLASSHQAGAPSSPTAPRSQGRRRVHGSGRSRSVKSSAHSCRGCARSRGHRPSPTPRVRSGQLSAPDKGVSHTKWHGPALPRPPQTDLEDFRPLTISRLGSRDITVQVISRRWERRDGS